MNEERYIVLSDTIIDREKIICIERDPEIAGRVWVSLEGTERRYFDGADARQIWNLFDKDDWRVE